MTCTGTMVNAMYTGTRNYLGGSFFSFILSFCVCVYDLKFYVNIEANSGTQHEILTILFV